MPRVVSLPSRAEKEPRHFSAQLREASRRNPAMKVGSIVPLRAEPPPARGPAVATERTFPEVLKGQSPSPPPKVDSPPASPVGRGITRLLEGAVAGEKRVDAILEAAARGKTFTAAELLAMQATVFRYSQTVEVLSRATDRLVGAIKQTLGAPV